MNFTKKDIIKNIRLETDLSFSEASSILESFLLLIKSKSKLKSIKISSFGTFSIKKTPKRLGRNPRTKDSYIIPIMDKLTFNPSKKIKEKIN